MKRDQPALAPPIPRTLPEIRGHAHASSDSSHRHPVPTCPATVARQARAPPASAVGRRWSRLVAGRRPQSSSLRFFSPPPAARPRPLVLVVVLFTFTPSPSSLVVALPSRVNNQPAPSLINHLGPVAISHQDEAIGISLRRCATTTLRTPAHINSAPCVKRVKQTSFCII
ncbi:hypothetical protein ACHAWF_007641 [Thalassiosira exigua]